jgi:hypothetical protein
MIPVIAAHTSEVDVGVIVSGHSNVIHHTVRYAAAHVAAAVRIKVAGSLWQIAKTDVKLSPILRFELGEVIVGPRFDLTLRGFGCEPMQFITSLTTKIPDFLIGGL